MQRKCGHRVRIRAGAADAAARAVVAVHYSHGAHGIHVHWQGLSFAFACYFLTPPEDGGDFSSRTRDAVVELNRRACNGDPDLPCVRELGVPVMQAVGAEGARAAVARALAALTSSGATRNIELPKAVAAFAVPSVSCGFSRASLRHRFGVERCKATSEQADLIGRRLFNQSWWNWVVESDLTAAEVRYRDCWVDCHLVWEGNGWLEEGGRCCVGELPLTLALQLSGQQRLASWPC